MTRTEGLLALIASELSTTNSILLKWVMLDKPRSLVDDEKDEILEHMDVLTTLIGGEKGAGEEEDDEEKQRA